MHLVEYTFKIGKFIEIFFTEIVENINGEYYSTLFCNKIIKGGLSAIHYPRNNFVRLRTLFDLIYFKYWKSLFKYYM